MHVINTDPNLSKTDTYREIGTQLTGLFADERNGLANAANMCALLYQVLPDVNWVGFYFLQDGELVLGPFQGKVACVRIALGRGVCGTAAQRREILVVPDVHEVPGPHCLRCRFAFGNRRSVDTERTALGRARSGQPELGAIRPRIERA